jgi:hypothetical protein
VAPQILRFLVGALRDWVQLRNTSRHEIGIFYCLFPRF